MPFLLVLGTISDVLAHGFAVAGTADAVVGGGEEQACCHIVVGFAPGYIVAVVGELGTLGYFSGDGIRTMEI